MSIDYQYSDDYNEQLHKQWLKFINNEPVQDDMIRPAILRLWQELRNQGVDPYDHPVEYLPKKEFERILEENKLLIDVAMSFLDNLYNNVPFTSSIFSLLDKNGVPLTGFQAITTPEYSDYLESNGIFPGMTAESLFAYAIEARICIESKTFSWCCSEENYMAVAKNWSCFCAPIFDGNKELIGVLSISDMAKFTNPHSMGITISTAKAIENEIQMRLANEKISAAASQLASIIDSTPLGTLVADDRGIITHVNKNALKILRLDTENDIKGRELKEVLKDNNRLFMRSPLPAFSEQEITLTTSRGQIRCYAEAKTFENRELTIRKWSIITLKAAEYVQTFAKNISSSHAYYKFADIIGGSKAISDVLFLGKIAAKSASTVLITGPSGTGKELFAQAIHSASDRAAGPFISINCGALPAGLVESELFGYEGGAFTGAKKSGQMGKFELANNGTLFLDEIGEMPLSVQASILRALETKIITRIGGDRSIPVDVRIIAATNRDLIEMVSEKEFREDLYYRLNVLHLQIPPLKSRKEDIPPLAEAFLDTYNRKLGKTNINLSKAAYSVLDRYDFPGNVRELENIIERVVNITESDTVITEETLAHFISIPSEKTSAAGFSIQNSPSGQLKNIERDLIIRTLAENHGSIKKSAEIIGIGRRTLYRKCDEYDIDYASFRK